MARLPSIEHEGTPTIPGVEVLRVDSIGHRFGERSILSSATVRAHAGKVGVLFGRNGIGKSTLLRIAVGLLQPTTGVTHFRGRSRLRVSLPQLAREGLFWLPDHDVLSATIPLGVQLELFRDRFAGRSVASSAALCGVEHLLASRPHELSGGELRRAEIAAAFVRAPVCLVADEPLRGVAPRDADEIGQLFRELAAGGAAVLVTGHETAHLLECADQVTWCTAGTTYELGSPDAARQHEMFRREYLRRV